MAKKKEKKEVLDKQGGGIVLDSEAIQEEPQGTVVPANELAEKANKPNDQQGAPARREIVNCLRNEKIIVRHIPKATGLVTDPKHVLYGGMSNNATRRFCVPRLSSGIYVNVLTKEEKDFLEQALGLEYNALSIHRKVDNFWDDTSENGISHVTLGKHDNVFDLSSPEDYIRYKILKANKTYIAPSLKELQDHPLATYQFVIISEGEEVRNAKAHMSSIQQSYMEYGKISEDFDKLRVVIETLSGRPIAPTTKIDWLQTKANEFIQANSKLFLSVVTDSLLDMKVILKKAVDEGIVSFRSNQLYLRENNQPLCEYNEESTLGNAAKFLANPRHQDILFAIQAKLKK